MASIQPTKSKSTFKMPPAAPMARPGSKLAKLLALMQRPHGATIEELVKATSWQKHTVRGVISGAVKKKLRQKVMIIVQGDRRAYTITKPGSSKGAARSASKSPKAASARPVITKSAIAELK